MTPAEFLQLPETQRMLERAQQSAALPIAVHAVNGNREGLRACGWGACGVCAHIATLPGGRAACRASRGAASAMALEQHRPIAFVCHAGLSCITLPAWGGAPFALTMGPFVPEGCDGALADSVTDSLCLLQDTPTAALPVPLDDIRRVPPSAPMAAAQWLHDSLDALWKQQASASPLPQANASFPRRRESSRPIQPEAARPLDIVGATRFPASAGNDTLQDGSAETRKPSRRPNDPPSYPPLKGAGGCDPGAQVDNRFPHQSDPRSYPPLKGAGGCDPEAQVDNTSPHQSDPWSYPPLKGAGGCAPPLKGAGGCGPEAQVDNSFPHQSDPRSYPPLKGAGGCGPEAQVDNRFPHSNNPRPPRRPSTPEAAFPAETVALLLSAGNRRRARAFLAHALDTRTAQSPGIRALALAAQVVDAAARAGADTSRARATLAEHATTLTTTALSSAEALSLVMKALARLAPRSNAHSELAALDALISSRLPETVTLQEVAKETGIPASTIAWRLQKRFGLSFTEYIGRLRVEEAKRMLCRTRLSATEISRRVGIGDQSYFSKVFKRHTGLNPLEYRQRHGAHQARQA